MVGFQGISSVPEGFINFERREGPERPERPEKATESYEVAAGTIRIHTHPTGPHHFSAGRRRSRGPKDDTPDRTRPDPYCSSKAAVSFAICSSMVPSFGRPILRLPSLTIARAARST